MSDRNTTEDPVREHTFDGIQEYDKSMPNWWLFTLYATIAFSIGYWIYFQKTDMGITPEEELKIAFATLNESIAAKREASGSVELQDKDLWAMSLDPAIVEAGKATYTTICAACHGPELQGAIGVSLIDSEWVHGDDPLTIRGTITNGVLEKGMPPWGPILGEQKVNEVTAFVLSHHTQPNSG